MSDNVIHLPIALLQVGPCNLVLLLTWQFFLPPGFMVDPVQGLTVLQLLLLLLKLWIVRFKDAAVDVVAAGSAHCEELLPLDIEHLPPHQVDHRVSDALHLPAVTLLHGVLGQQVVVFVVARDEQGGVRPLLQPVQLALFLGAAVPDASKIALIMN